MLWPIIKYCCNAFAISVVFKKGTILSVKIVSKIPTIFLATTKVVYLNKKVNSRVTLNPLRFTTTDQYDKNPDPTPTRLWTPLGQG